MSMQMQMNTTLSQRQEMKLAPRMIQAMKILQLPAMALEEQIELELEKNPLLERVDPTAPVETLDSLNRAPGITKLAVVVIFQDIRRSRLGPLQQRQAAHEGHNRPGGKLVRRGDIHQTGRGRGIWQCRSDQAFSIGRHRHEAGAGGQKDLASALVVRLLDQDAVAGIE